LRSKRNRTGWKRFL